MESVLEQLFLQHQTAVTWVMVGLSLLFSYARNTEPPRPNLVVLVFRFVADAVVAFIVISLILAMIYIWISILGPQIPIPHR